jgi:hypothetical protein
MILFFLFSLKPRISFGEENGTQGYANAAQNHGSGINAHHSEVVKLLLFFLISGISQRNSK